MFLLFTSCYLKHVLSCCWNINPNPNIFFFKKQRDSIVIAVTICCAPQVQQRYSVFKSPQSGGQVSTCSRGYRASEEIWGFAKVRPLARSFCACKCSQWLFLFQFTTELVTRSTVANKIHVSPFYWPWKEFSPLVYIVAFVYVYVHVLYMRVHDSLCVFKSCHCTVCVCVCICISCVYLSHSPTFICNCREVNNPSVRRW